MHSTIYSKKKLTIIAGALALAGAASASVVTEFFSASVPESRHVIAGSNLLNPSHAKRVGTRPERLGENNPLVPPFCETFDNFRAGMEHDDIYRYFDIIDANGDDRSWGMYNYAGDRPYGKCTYLKYPMEGQPAADDWIITRAIKLEKGKYYCVSVYAGLFNFGNENTPEVFEVKIGNYNDVAGMKTTVIPATNVTSQTMKRSQGWFCPKATGKYYVGVHGISPTYSNYYNYLFIDNIAVDAPKSGGEPDMVTDVEMTNDPNGTTAINIKFVAPEKAIDGSQLTSLTSIVVMRGDKEIGKINAPEPGKTYSVTDTPESEGTYEYSITAFNEAGEGVMYYQSHEAGIAKPAAPAVTEFKEVENGKIKLAWSAPTNDVNGNILNPEMLKYNVDDISDEHAHSVANLTDKLELTYDAEVGEGQKAAMCRISAVLNGNASDYAYTNIIPVGTPYKLPYHNSFTVNDYYKYVMLMDVQEEVTWRMLDDNSDPNAQDGDNGYICMIGSMPGQSCELSSGKIDMTEADSPILSFYTYVYSEDENLIKVNATDLSTGKKTQVARVDLSDFPRVGWHKVTLPLKGCAGKVVSIGLQGEIVSHGYIPIDNMLINQMHKVDLAVNSVEAPLRAEVNEPFEVIVNIFNTGVDKVSDYTVSLMDGDREVATVPGEPVDSFDEVLVALTDSFSSISPASTEYHVVINAPGDGNLDNNESQPFSVVFNAPIHPTVTSLKGTEDGEKVTLTWEAPDLSKAAPEEALEDFEKYEAFSNELTGWSMIDGDKGYIPGFENMTMPVNGTQQAYWVMSAVDDFAFVPTHSDKNVLVAMYTFDSRNMAIPNDDWLISPELYGGKQAIDFWATSLTENYGCEQIEVYYSTTGKDRDDFKPVMARTEVPETWTNYFVALPEGTKYFAIRYLSDNRYMLILDDITYIPTGEPRKIELKGYNVYRNGVKLNDAPVAATSYATTREKDSDAYFVTVVYDLGESAGSNVVNLGVTSITEIEADDPAAPVELYNLQGIKVNPATAPAGIYLRRTATHVEKIILK